jgi:hypothetical protein
MVPLESALKQSPVSKENKKKAGLRNGKVEGARRDARVEAASKQKNPSVNQRRNGAREDDVDPKRNVQHRGSANDSYVEVPGGRDNRRVTTPPRNNIGGRQQWREEDNDFQPTFEGGRGNHFAEGQADGAGRNANGGRGGGAGEGGGVFIGSGEKLAGGGYMSGLAELKGLTEEQVCFPRNSSCDCLHG